MNGMTSHEQKGASAPTKDASKTIRDSFPWNTFETTDSETRGLQAGNHRYCYEDENPGLRQCARTRTQ